MSMIKWRISRHRRQVQGIKDKYKIIYRRETKKIFLKAEERVGSSWKSSKNGWQINVKEPESESSEKIYISNIKRGDK